LGRTIIGIAILLVALALSVLAFRLSTGMGWHWGSAAFLGLVPLAATYFFGLIGLLGAAAFVGSLYKASA
jgi:hypothetical protein